MSLWLIFAILLFAACAVLLVVEIFVPSFGLLTLFALACLIGGGTIFFNYGTVTGWTGVGLAAVLIPIVWIITYRTFPNTRFGKSIILGKVERARGDAIPDTEELKSLLGKEGTVLTPLRPVGMCDFSGHRVECVAETGYIDKGVKIRVINVEGTQLTVRQIEET
jgi:membrane-bound serine protease (ClpP class)